MKPNPAPDDQPPHISCNWASNDDPELRRVREDARRQAREKLGDLAPGEAYERSMAVIRRMNITEEEYEAFEKAIWELKKS